MSGKGVLSNLAWRFAERCSAQLVKLLVELVLARILTPADYGVIALVSVFTNILQVFVDNGLGTALIQKKDADDLDFSSVFYFNFALCSILYGIMFVTAPYIAQFYNNPSLVPVIRVLSLKLVISGIKNIQQSYVSRNMMFRKFFFSTLGGTLFSAVLGVLLASNGAGAWALVAQQISNSCIDTLILWIAVSWRPKRIFSWKRLKSLISFGWKLLVAALLNTVYGNLRSLIIGKAYTPSDLAFYDEGQKFPALIVSNINTSIDSVLLPAMASQQTNKERVKGMTRRAIKTSSYIMWPLMVGLAACAKPLVRLVLTDKWLPCVPFLQIFCIIYAFYPIHTANLNAITALGRSDVFLKLEIIKKVIGLATIIITMHFGTLAMAFGMLVTAPISAFINAFPNRRLLDYSFKDQLMDLLPYILLATFMGGCVYPIQFLPVQNWVQLALQIVSGACIYMLGSKLFHFEISNELRGLLSHVISKHKHN